MQKQKRFMVSAVVGLLAVACFAAKYEQLNVGELSLDGTKVTATAAQLNTLGPLSSLVLTNVAKSTGAVTATAVVTPQAPSAVTPTITVTATMSTNTWVYLDGSSNVVTNSIVYVSAVSAACSALPVFATNATVAVTVAGGDAVVTNITVQR